MRTSGAQLRERLMAAAQPAVPTIAASNAALYLVGSLARGTYDPRASDIDLVVVLSPDASDSQILQLLESVKDALRRSPHRPPSGWGRVSVREAPACPIDEVPPATLSAMADEVFELATIATEGLRIGGTVVLPLWPSDPRLLLGPPALAMKHIVSYYAPLPVGNQWQTNGAPVPHWAREMLPAFVVQCRLMLRGRWLPKEAALAVYAREFADVSVPGGTPAVHELEPLVSVFASEWATADAALQHPFTVPREVRSPALLTDAEREFLLLRGGECALALVRGGAARLAVVLRGTSIIGVAVESPEGRLMQQYGDDPGFMEACRLRNRRAQRSPLIDASG